MKSRFYRHVMQLGWSLVRFSQRRSGPATTGEYESIIKGPFKAEYIGMTPKTQVASPGNVTFGWVDVGPKNTPRRRLPGLFRGR